VALARYKVPGKPVKAKERPLTSEELGAELGAERMELIPLGGDWFYDTRYDL
jgi:hypothetical protein